MNKQMKKWNEGFEIAKEYKEEYGSLEPRTDCIYKGFKLGEWISNQKRLPNKDVISDYTKYRMNMLDDLGIKWVREYIPKEWMKNYSMAKEYYKEYGDLLISKDYMIGDFNLYNWVIKQKSLINDKDPQSISKVKLLNVIGMTWDTKHDLKWMKTYAKVVAYCNEYGSLKDMKTKYKYKGFSIGQWIANQRFEYNMSNLSDERFKLLDKLGMRW